MIILLSVHGRNVEKAILSIPKFTEIFKGTSLQCSDHVLQPLYYASTQHHLLPDLSKNLCCKYAHQTQHKHSMKKN